MMVIGAPPFIGPFNQIISSSFSPFLLREVNLGQLCFWPKWSILKLPRTLLFKHSNVTKGVIAHHSNHEARMMMLKERRTGKLGDFSLSFSIVGEVGEFLCKIKYMVTVWAHLWTFSKQHRWHEVWLGSYHCNCCCMLDIRSSLRGAFETKTLQWSRSFLPSHHECHIMFQWVESRVCEATLTEYTLHTLRNLHSGWRWRMEKRWPEPERSGESGRKGKSYSGHNYVCLIRTRMF